MNNFVTGKTKLNCNQCSAIAWYADCYEYKIDLKSDSEVVIFDRYTGETKTETIKTLIDLIILEYETCLHNYGYIKNKDSAYDLEHTNFIKNQIYILRGDNN